MAITLKAETGPDIHWQRAATRNGRKVNVFACRVPEQKGEIPKGLEHQELEIALDCKPAEAGRELLLPSNYRLHSLREAALANINLPREERRFIQENNETDYNGYRKFESSSSVGFGGDAGPGR